MQCLQEAVVEFLDGCYQGKQTFTGGKKQTLDEEGQGTKRFKFTTSKESKAKV